MSVAGEAYLSESRTWTRLLPTKEMREFLTHKTEHVYCLKKKHKNQTQKQK